jgi:hypothetical protein
VSSHSRTERTLDQSGKMVLPGCCPITRTCTGRETRAEKEQFIRVLCSNQLISNLRP